MNFYETMYIIHPALQAGRLDDIVNTVDKKIESLKGEKLYFDNWGKKKLSYAIEKQKYGTYILMQFSMNGEGIQELMDEFEHNSNVLRYLINRIEKEDILEQKDETPIVEKEDSKDEALIAEKDGSKDGAPSIEEKESKDDKESVQNDDKDDEQQTEEKVEE